ncbi:MAG: hypothetical protein ACKVOM_11700, partial [Ferruginibacter sp.]
MRYVTFIFFIFHFSSSAQTNSTISKTKFNKFIEKPSIEWAIYHNDKLQTDSPDLKNILLTKAKEKKIKIFAPMGFLTQDEKTINYINYDDIKNRTDDVIINGPLGEASIYKKQTEIPELEPKGLMNLNQILFVEEGKLFSNVNRVSPIIQIITPSGIYLGNAEYFSTALNTNPRAQKSKKDKIIFLKSTSTTIAIDSINKNDRLKETFGHNLIETLWPHIVSN